MELRDRREATLDFASDRGPGGAIPPRRTSMRGHGGRRARLLVALITLLLLPAQAMAQEPPPGESTESTTTTIASSTTTIVDSTSTTLASSTTTSMPPSTTTTLSDQDPLEGEDEDLEPELLPLPSIVFPIVGRATYRDTYGADRDGGARRHNGTDIIADRGTPVVAVGDGVVERLGDGPLAGLYVVIRHASGWRSVYVHLNNDSPGTDNGLTVGFGPGIEVGARVEAGTVIGYVGDSGNAEETTPHLHFELHQPDGYRANPYPALQAARRASDTLELPTVDYDEVTAANTELIAHLDPGTGFNADIAALDGYAYIGTWGNEERCPGTGVRVFDLADVSDPEEITAFADHTTFPGSAAASLWVGNVATESFRGRLGVVALMACDTMSATADGEFAGFAVYDLDDPGQPELLTSVPRTATGVESLDVSVSGQRVLLAISGRQASLDGASLIDTVSIFDMSEPGRPFPVSVWQPPATDLPGETDPAPGTWIPGVGLVVDGITEPAPEPLLGELGRDVTWLDHETLAVDLTRGGFAVVDVSVTTAPMETWNSATLAGAVPALETRAGELIGDRFLIVDEVLASPEDGSPAGRQLVVDLMGGPATVVADYQPEVPEGASVQPELLVPHESTPYGTRTGVSAWLSGGIRIVDFDDPQHPAELANFVPAPAFDPQRWWSGSDEGTRTPMVWDVDADGGYVYISDHNSGLWIVRATIAVDPIEGPEPVD
ncbi:MAG: M23 family metallopeptidase [Acidimicrobiia bacterium]